ncbi:unnamed protein product [Bursaphelenchus okinawaensis]|uniref:phosphoserine transaminase n=1 Tax=Bursaphelenchus okinawaensis TaxID=465554 RepID=A0A811JUH0_9BILA|nr:unnamed protein product [Bursaphelenchus okinawaensis]CAG9083631.1 unnamed protein product [Bursaphelenchus okinawaensis]
MTARKLNFGAGPAKLPESVLEHAQKELFDFNGLGLSVLEISHRSPEFKKIIGDAGTLLRELLSIPDNYEVLFMHGGGSGQFAAIPLNLRSLSTTTPPSADYLITGAWSQKAAKEAEKYIHVNKVSSCSSHDTIPPASEWKTSTEAAYLWYCANETIHGVEFKDTPEVPEGVNLVADISSNILSSPIDVAKHAAIIAGTQKNLGIGGLTIVIIRRDLIGRHDPQTPGILNYADIHKNESLYNTPCVFAVYITKLVLEWIKNNGGLEEMSNDAEYKSSLIYDIIDHSNGFYTSPVQKSVRSRMNIPFRIKGNDEKLEEKFLAEAKAKGMIALKGHRSVGGIRASLYNAITKKEAETLASFMKEFQSKN